MSDAQNHRPWEGFDLDSGILLQRGWEVAGENSILSGQKEHGSARVLDHDLLGLTASNALEASVVNFWDSALPNMVFLRTLVKLESGVGEQRDVHPSNTFAN